jgi:hypothetical protein
MMFLTLLLVLLFFAAVALTLFFLFSILLPTLGQQGTLVENPLMSLSPETVPSFDGISSESPQDFLPLTHRSPKDCKVLEALCDSPLDRKRMYGAFESCMYTCPRVQINFHALIQGTPAQEIGLTAVPDCNYCSAETVPAQQTVPKQTSTQGTSSANKLTSVVNTAKQKASEFYVKILKAKEK